jgi:hypothetical protein
VSRLACRTLCRGVSPDSISRYIFRGSVFAQWKRFAQVGMASVTDAYRTKRAVIEVGTSTAVTLPARPPVGVSGGQGLGYGQAGARCSKIPRHSDDEGHSAPVPVAAKPGTPVPSIPRFLREQPRCRSLKRSHCVSAATDCAPASEQVTLLSSRRATTRRRRTRTTTRAVRRRRWKGRRRRRSRRRRAPGHFCAISLGVEW